LLTDAKGTSWTFYLYLGRIIYATGGQHPIRRWRRQLASFFPNLAARPSQLQADFARLQAANNGLEFWEYSLLCQWVEQNRITREDAARMIRDTLIEIFFDVTQALQITCELKRINAITTRLALIDAEPVIVAAKKRWMAWQGAKIADRSPDMAPVITKPDQLQQRTSAQMYQTLSQLLDGQQTLRDLSVRMRRDVLTVTRSLLPYIQLGLVKLTKVADLRAPISMPSNTPPPPKPKKAQGQLIACIDDSPAVCQAMEKILTHAGYQFMSINDPLRAVAALLARRPALIFLDLVMPNANGYEICSQLRKVAQFNSTPIVILTGNDGIIDRVRAKLVKSNDFIGKPVKAKTVLEVAQKYLMVGSEP
ncbi:MAG: response regulator, partial [Cyanobacteria bacterium P01_H01_bin.15]